VPDIRSPYPRQRARRLWIRLLEARIRRIDRKQQRLSKARTQAIIFATKHRRKLVQP
jgi:hypothetical protein